MLSRTALLRFAQYAFSGNAMLALLLLLMLPTRVGTWDQPILQYAVALQRVMQGETVVLAVGEAPRPGAYECVDAPGNPRPGHYRCYMLSGKPVWELVTAQPEPQCTGFT